MTTVKFSSELELIDELKEEFGLLQGTISLPHERPILRLSGLLKSIPKLAPIRQLFVVATMKDTRGNILRLERYCGDVWGLEPEDKKAKERAGEVENTIEKTCKELGIEIRGGTFEE